MLIIFWSWRKEDIGDNIYIGTNTILEFVAQRNSKLDARLIQRTRKETKESKIIPLQHIAHNTGSCAKPCFFHHVGFTLAQASSSHCGSVDKIPVAYKSLVQINRSSKVNGSRNAIVACRSPFGFRGSFAGHLGCPSVILDLFFFSRSVVEW
jgi:hypothetical protein